MRKLITYFVLLFIVIACAENDGTELTIDIDAETTQEEFLANLLERCDDTYAGESTYPADPPHDGLETVELRATISTCTSDEVHISLRAGDDETHTIVITYAPEGLLMRHKHRDTDGSPRDITDYGGLANDRGTSTRQYFEADQSAIDMIPEAENNVWIIDLGTDDETLIYSLERQQEQVFRAELEKTS
jgi:hypothetical protein